MDSTDHNQKSLDNLFFCVTMLLVFIMAVRVPLDSDMWWHLKAGEYTIAKGIPLLRDIFSYTRQAEVWINHSWLGEVILYWFYRYGGFWGLGLCVALTAVASMGLLYKTMRGGPVFKAWFVVLAAIISSYIWSPRPQIFSQLMLVILARLVLKNQATTGIRWTIGIFILFVLWSNLHGGYGLGIFLLIFLILGEIADFILRSGQKEDLPVNFKRYFVWLLAGLGGVLVNPNGLNTLIVPFKTVGVQTLQNLIDEWASPDFHQLAMQPFLILLFTVVFSLAFSKKRPSGFEVIGFLGFTYLALVAKRNFAPFAVIATIVAGNHLPEILSNVITYLSHYFSEKVNLKNRNETRLPDRMRQVVNFSLVGFLGLVAILKWYYVTYPAVVEMYEARFYPQMAINYLKSNGIPSGNMFNSYGWGGYLIWNLPETKVFVDGRTDLFGDELLIEWLKIVSAQEGWEQTVEKWQIEWFLIEPHQPIVTRLLEKQWKVRYQDEVSIVLVRDDTPSD